MSELGPYENRMPGAGGRAVRTESKATFTDSRPRVPATAFRVRSGWIHRLAIHLWRRSADNPHLSWNPALYDRHHPERHHHGGQRAQRAYSTAAAEGYCTEPHARSDAYRLSAWIPFSEVRGCREPSRLRDQRIRNASPADRTG